MTGLTEERTAVEGIAIVGMAGRFPGAADIEAFWRNLREGVESISSFTDEELLASGIDPSKLGPNYVRARGVLAGVELFDASFFGINPREAEIIDPQHRVFLETAWEAVESAGYNPERYDGAVGVFAGPNVNTYFLHNLYTNPELLEKYGYFEMAVRSRPDLLTTLTSYKLNLKGPSVAVQTACSTSLVAVHMACQSLLNRECDMALAGGVSINLPQRAGYFYQEGGINSPDGRCRPFDAAANGTVFGNGVGVVLLKRLEEALADGDTLHAVIRGSAVNNDGSVKVGYTAPGLEGQAAVIAEAQAMAEVEPATIGYVETHGTATSLGDPVEFSALSQVFSGRNIRPRSCALGSLKANIGHLDTAAGIAGLIKATLALRHKLLPPSPYFRAPNPQIDLSDSPFYLNPEPEAWESEGGRPRRAGVSSFGIGGTNAHVVLEEGPESEPGDEPRREEQLLVLSARSEAALAEATRRLAAHLEGAEGQGQTRASYLADVAHTLQVGRKAWAHRAAVVCRTHADAGRALTSGVGLVRGVSAAGQRPRVVFMFPGQGAQYAGMCKELCEREESFRRPFDEAAEALRGAPGGLNICPALWPAEVGEAAEARLRQTQVAQPALFAVEYALARMWMSWGAEPWAMVGHSVGELVAAVLSGVMSLEEGARLVTARGRLMQRMAPGAMAAVGLGEGELRQRIEELKAGAAVSVAAANGPQLSVASGSEEWITRLEAELEKEGVWAKRLRTSHAFHSALMEPALEPFAAEVGRTRLSAPRVSYVSNVTGGWVTAAEATDAGYWVRHLRGTVKFWQGLETLRREAGEGAVFLEVGPGETLSKLARSRADSDEGGGARVVVTLGRMPGGVEGGEVEAVLKAAGELWTAGVELDWEQIDGGARRRRVELPTYPFERQRYWIEPQVGGARGGKGRVPSLKRLPEIADWFYAPVWKQSPAPLPASEAAEDGGACWLVFEDACGLGASLVSSLRGQGRDVVSVRQGERYRSLGRSEYALDPGAPADYAELLEELERQGRRVGKVVHLWGVTSGARCADAASVEETLRLARAAERSGFYSLLGLAQALGKRREGMESPEPFDLTVVTNNAQAVLGEELLYPEKATAAGPCRVIPKEYPNVNCRSVDVTLPASDAEREWLVGRLAAEAAARGAGQSVAYRGRHRWTQTFEPLPLAPRAPRPARLRERGVYLITGGLGSIGLTLAGYFARTARARLVLVGRTGLPERGEWERLTQTGAAAKIEKLRELEALGAEVLTFGADVSDPEAMRAVLERAAETFGRLDGVVHAAGVPGGGLMQLKTAAAAAEVLAPKVSGTLVLGALLKDVPLDFFVCCSSALAVTAPLGQVDYAAANAFMDAYAHASTHARGAFAVSVNWDAWREGGMAVEALAAQQPAAPVEAFAHPLFDGRLIESEASGSREVYVTRFRGAGHWILDEHRFEGRAVMPGTAFLEMARAAGERFTRGAATELRNVVFLSPLVVGDGEEKEVHTVVEREGETVGFRVLGRSSKSNGAANAWQEHARGQLVAAPAQAPKRYAIEELKRRCGAQQIDLGESNGANGRGAHFAFGPRWKSLKQVHVGADELLGRLELPEEFAADLEEFGLHPALLDVATGVAARQSGDGFYLPFSYQRVRLSGRLPRRLYSYVRRKGGGREGRETLAFDVTLLDEQGAERVRIEDFILKRVDGLPTPARAAAPSEERKPAPAAVAGGLSARPVAALTDAAQPAPGRLADGISSEEGVEAFARILSGEVPPQVVVVTRDLHALLERAESFTQAELLEKAAKTDLPAPSHPRPALRTAYAAPTNEVEQRLAELWERLLGIEQVGVNDNFFELGGHSLLSLQLLSRLRESFQIELSMREVFEAPTVAELARVVEGVIMRKIMERIKDLPEAEAQVLLQQFQ
jgi:acyl transferase domain-containing protein